MKVTKGVARAMRSFASSAESLVDVSPAAHVSSQLSLSSLSSFFCTKMLKLYYIFRQRVAPEVGSSSTTTSGGGGGGSGASSSSSNAAANNSTSAAAASKSNANRRNALIFGALLQLHTR